MERSRETREAHYKLACKLLKLMVTGGILTQEEYQKIDALNRETFSPELAKVYA